MRAVRSVLGVLIRTLLFPSRPPYRPVSFKAASNVAVAEEQAYRAPGT
jgi:hypothetical protein